MTYEPALSDGTLAGARKGSGNYHLIITGKAAHAGRAFHEGANAVAGAAIIAARLHGLNGQRAGVTVNVAKISGGGALNVVRHTIRLKVKANKIPEEIVIDLTGKDIGDSIHISSIPLPEGARGAEFGSELGYTYSYDTRISGLNPNGGILLRFSQDFSGLGGDVKYLSSEADRGCEH